MRVLVTGCAGFIGSRVSSLLLQQGHSVLGIDNLIDVIGDGPMKHWRLGLLKGQAGFAFHQADVSDFESLSAAVGADVVDAVANLAARAGVRASLEDPWAYYETNLTGTLNMLELCREHGIRNFVLASTSSAYGDVQRPFKEEQAPNRPLSPYAASKTAAEALCYTYHRLYDMDIKVMRYFTVYGPAGRIEMSIFRFVQRIAEGRPITVFGDGTQERDFTYVEDIARGTVAALDLAGYEIINLGNDAPVPLNQAIEMIEDLLDRKAIISHQPAHPADVQATWADISKARELLRWDPEVQLDQGLKACVDWYLKNREWAKDLEPKSV